MTKTLRLLKKVLRNPRAFARYFVFCIKQYGYFDLIEYAASGASDKGVSGHDYIRVYDHFLRGRRYEPLEVCEIGLAMKDSADLEQKVNTDWRHKRYSDAPSLLMWRKYLPKAHLIGFDIRKFSPSRDRNAEIIQGDQSSREDLQRIATNGRTLDVVIDDGLHASRHQQITFSALFSSLKSCGIFFIEDLCYQPEGFEEKDIPLTLDVLKRLQATGEWTSPLSTPEERRAIERDVAAVYIYDSRKGTAPDFIDCLAVIIKK